MNRKSRSEGLSPIGDFTNSGAMSLRDLVRKPRGQTYHPWRYAGIGVALIFTATIIQAVVMQEAFDWKVVTTYFFDPAILRGLLVTGRLAGATMVVAISLGVLLAIMRMSSAKLPRYIASGYIWLFRGAPSLVQLIFWYNIAAIFPEIRLGIPFGPALVTLDANKILTPFVAAVLALGLHEAAYMAEITRGGLLSVNETQLTAARSIGLTPVQAFVRVRLPQALVAALPPTVNQLISVTKLTALVSVISVRDLLFSAQLIYHDNYLIMPLLIVATIWYLVVVTLLMGIQNLLERRLNPEYRTSVMAPPLGPDV